MTIKPCANTKACTWSRNSSTTLFSRRTCKVFGSFCKLQATIIEFVYQEGVYRHLTDRFKKKHLTMLCQEVLNASHRLLNTHETIIYSSQSLQWCLYHLLQVMKLWCFKCISPLMLCCFFQRIVSRHSGKALPVLFRIQVLPVAQQLINFNYLIFQKTYF